MDHPTRRLHPAGRHTSQVKHGDMFGIRTGDAIDRTQLADTVGRAQRRHTVNSAIAIRGISSIELVATANPAQLTVGGDGVIYWKSEVACDTEDIPDANLLQARENVLNDRLAQIRSLSWSSR